MLVDLARGMSTTCGVLLAWARRDFFSPGYVLSSKFERPFSRSEAGILLLTVIKNEQAHMQGMIRHSPCHSRPHSGCHLSMLDLARGMRTTCGVVLAWARRDFFSPGYVLNSTLEQRFPRREALILLLIVIENEQRTCTATCSA